MPRLFVAAWLPDEVRGLLAGLARPQVKGLRWTGPEQWHVTLRFLGPVAEVDGVVDALTAMEAAGPATAELGPTVDRFAHRILHVPVSGLDAVAAAVAGATAALGQPPEDRPFRGHVTLARVAKNGKVDLRPLAGGEVTARWDVGEVGLVESRLSPAGARYHVLERFTLPPRPEAGAEGPPPRRDGGPRRTS